SGSSTCCTISTVRSRTRSSRFVSYDRRGNYWSSRGRCEWTQFPLSLKRFLPSIDCHRRLDEPVVAAGVRYVPAADLADGVDPRGRGPQRVWQVELGVLTLAKQEAVAAAKINKELTHNLASVVDAIGGGIDRAGHVDGGVLTVAQDEAVGSVVGIVAAHDVA